MLIALIGVSMLAAVLLGLLIFVFNEWKWLFAQSQVAEEASRRHAEERRRVVEILTRQNVIAEEIIIELAQQGIQGGVLMSHALRRLYAGVNAAGRSQEARVLWLTKNLHPTIVAAAKTFQEMEEAKYDAGRSVPKA